MVDNFTKFAVAAPYKNADARETCKLIMEYWVSPYGAPIAIQPDNGPQFAASLTAEFLQLIDVIQVHSTPYHPQTNGLVERQNRTLINLLRSICSRKQYDWVEQLSTAMGANNATKSATSDGAHHHYCGSAERSLCHT